MTIDKAIEILTSYGLQPNDAAWEDYLDAVKLGVQALKRCKVLAENSPLWAAKPLPGETRE